MNNCPVCGVEMAHTHYGGEWGTEAEYFKCPNKCYYYNFAYGSTEIGIGNATFGWHYKTSKEKIKLINREINAVIEIEKEFYEKH